MKNHVHGLSLCTGYTHYREKIYETSNKRVLDYAKYTHNREYVYLMLQRFYDLKLTLLERSARWR